MTYFIEWEENGVCLKYNNSLNILDMMEANGVIYGNEQFDECEYYICNMLDIETVDLVKDEAIAISKMDVNATKWNYSLKLAMVTDNPEIIELLKEYKKHLHSSFWKVKVVSSIEDAREWVECESFSYV